MAKNENGIPICNCPEVACASSGGVVGGVMDGCGNHNGGGCGNNGNVSGEAMGECGGRGDCLDTKPLAYVYAPDQRFRMLYSAKDALSHGTLFEELYKPKGVYGNE